MENYAEASCVLKVNIHCGACKMKIVDVLGSICGEYNIDINAEEGLVRVFGLVDPNLLVKALSRTGYHAELKSAKIQHPKINRNYQNYGSGYDPYSYHGYNPHHGYGRPLPDPYSSYPRPIHPYYPGPDPYQPDPFHYGYSGRYVPSYHYGPNACISRPRPFADYPF